MFIKYCIHVVVLSISTNFLLPSIIVPLLLTLGETPSPSVDTKWMSSAEVLVSLAHHWKQSRQGDYLLTFIDEGFFGP